MPETVQAEALPPNVLAAEIRDAIEGWTDAAALEAAITAGREDRAQILALLGRLDAGG